MAQILPGIDHIVVLMLENRSFDNLFGGLYPASPSFHGLTGKEWNYNPASPGIGTWTVWQAGHSPAATTIPFPDPGEEFTDMNIQLFQTPSPVSCPSPTMGGFAANYARQPSSRYFPGYPSVQPVPRDIMQYYRYENLEISQTLAKTYGVSDVWFASAPVQTISNRTFVHTGTASKIPGTDRSRVNNGDYTAGLSFRNLIERKFDPPVHDLTVFEMLDRKNPDGKASACSDWEDPDRHRKLNWKVYYHDAPLSALCKYVYDHWCLDYLYGGNVYKYQGNFEHDIKHGHLPTYSFIEPAYTSVDYTANSNHPGGAIPDPLDLNAQNFPPPIDVKHGEALLAHVYRSLTEHPDVFARTLLIVTYDEHGGLYDHVKPGMAVSPFSPAIGPFNYDRYGVRVPAILINPRIKNKVFRPLDGQPETGCAGDFVTGLDHTSIIATLCQQFELGQPPTPRAAKAATLAGLVPPVGADEAAVEQDVLAAGAAADAAQYRGPKELGRSLRIRDWFRQRQVDSFEGDSLNNAVFATFALSWFAELRRASYPLRELVDLEAKAEEALGSIGVHDTHQLGAALAADGGVERIAEHVGADPARVLRWAQQAELLRIPGICGDDAYLLVAAGTTSIRELAQASPGMLQREIEARMQNLGINYKIEHEEVDRWIDAARRMIAAR
jgi:phospholipase C